MLIDGDDSKSQVSLNGSITGMGPVQKGHLKGQVGALKNKIDLAAQARPASTDAVSDVSAELERSARVARERGSLGRRVRGSKARASGRRRRLHGPPRLQVRWAVEAPSLVLKAMDDRQLLSEPLLDAGEAARLLRVPRSTPMSWCVRGVSPTFGSGGAGCASRASNSRAGSARTAPVDVSRLAWTDCSASVRKASEIGEPRPGGA